MRTIKYIVILALTTLVVTFYQNCSPVGQTDTSVLTSTSGNSGDTANTDPSNPADPSDPMDPGPMNPPPAAGVPTKGNQLLMEPFEDINWASRGWYDGTNAGGVSPGGISGNALKWTFNSGSTKPNQFSVIRQKVPAVDEFILEYYLKFDTGWRGSGQAYHPHFLHFVSSEDTDYQGLSRSNSGLYFETLADQSPPYTNYPVIAHQDMHRVNTAGGVPNNLVNSTENRSANHCNTPASLSGANIAICYNDGAGWYSANGWKAPSVSIASNTWTKITVYIRSNSFSGNVANFDGIMKLWVDDTLAIDQESVLFAAGANEGATWDKLVLAPYIGDGSPIAQTMWIDELGLWSVAP